MKTLCGCLIVPALLLAALLVRGDDKKDEPKVKLTQEEQAIFEMTNKEREKEKLPPLTLNPVLTEAARAHSANMAKKGELNHVLDGKNPAERAKEAGYDWAYVGENIANTFDTPKSVMDLWMTSAHH